MNDSIIVHLTEVENELYNYGPNVSQEEIREIKQTLFYIWRLCLKLDGTLSTVE